MIEQVLEKVIDTKDSAPFEPDEVSQTVRDAFHDEVQEAVKDALKEAVVATAQKEKAQPAEKGKQD
jgi:hypothetical protein